MTGFVTTMLFMVAFAWPGGGLAVSDADSKCGARPGADPDMPDYVLLLDLELFVGDEEDITERLASVQDHQIARHEIVCWQWLEANYGVEVRRGGGFTLTKEWMERTRRDRVAALEALVSAQDRHRETTGEYAARIEELPDFGALSDHGIPGHLSLRRKLQPAVSEHLRAVVADVGQAVGTHQRGHVGGSTTGHDRREGQLDRQATQCAGGFGQDTGLLRRRGYLGDGAVVVDDEAQSVGAEQRSDGVEVG